MAAPYRPCDCGDIVPGAPWPRPMARGREIVSINRETGKVLVACGTCGGHVIVEVDPRGNASAAQCAPENIRASFPEWLKSESAASGLGEDEIVHAMGRDYIASKKTFGCDLCLGMKPGEAGAQMNPVASSPAGLLYQCRRCGTFRWLRPAARDASRAADWDYLTTCAVLSFRPFLEAEALRRGSTPERLAGEILERSV
ncbi:MAG: hypothetical protein EPN93_20335 [Spirochaetes bacterium]|nr:MAG: hypothetical protein EPN93_20335 [Spirochaetota bacterium]